VSKETVNLGQEKRGSLSHRDGERHVGFQVSYRILALDVSSKTGFAVLDVDEDSNPVGIQLSDCGLIRMPVPLDEAGIYPWNYITSSKKMGAELCKLVAKYGPRVVVIEETNRGKQRYSQKLLEFLHGALLNNLSNITNGVQTPAVFYLSTSEWRSRLGIRLSKEDKKNNGKLNRAKRIAGGNIRLVDKKSLGIRGKVTPKHLAVKHVNEEFGLNFKVKDNDIADSICLGEAFALGARPCDGNEDYLFNPYSATKN
jgi:hypothetical protein